MGSKVERHLSRLAMPKNWKLDRKSPKWVTRPRAGPHPLSRGMPLQLILREVLGYAKTSKEVKNLLTNHEVLIDGIRRNDPKFIVGIMDLITIPFIDKHYIVLLNRRNQFEVVPIKKEESKAKLCRINGKSAVNGKIQLNLYDGKNIVTEKGDYKIGSTLLMETKSQKIKEVFRMEKGSTAYLTGGKHIGDIGVIEEVMHDRVMLKGADKKVFEAPIKYVYIVGKDKPLIPVV